MDDLKIPDTLPEGYEPTPEDGLSEEEAARRLAAGQGNTASEDPGRSVPQIVCANLFTLFNLLNVALALCLIAVGSYRNILFMGVVISNTLIGTVQELRAHQTIKRLKLLNMPVVRVIRGGKEREIASNELVLGDLTVLTTGNQVPADAIVREGRGTANESLLTGESDAVSKEENAWLMSGSYITSGRFVAQLVHVGEDSYISRLTRSAKKIKHPKSELMSDMQRLIRVVSALLIPLGILLFCKQRFMLEQTLERAVPTAVAAMIGMIPEGLMLLTSVALTVGVIKLGRRQVLVQELYGIETLARVDVLCLDKTGTITTGEMKVDGIVPLNAAENQVKADISRFLGAMNEHSGTTAALAAAFLPAPETPLATLPFSSARKLSAVTLADGRTLVLGAPNFVLDERQYAGEISEKVKREAASGHRVLLLAECDGAIDGDTLPPVTRPLALVCLNDVIRDNAAETLEYFRRQGVSVRVISGDDPTTVSAIAGRIGLENGDHYVDASTLKTPEALRDAADRYAVFGRVTPEQKRLLVEALKAAGHNVAMTGDGVNDIPALKAADCSIAMAGGSDAAKNAAQLTLLDPDFASLPAVVGEGRRVVNNITRAASLFLIKTLYSFALALLTLALPVAYPFQPIQLTLISTLTIGTPSFFLALEPNTEPIRGRFLRNVLMRAVPGAAAVAIISTAAMFLEHAGWTAEACSTAATIAAGCIGLMSLARVSLPFTKLRAAVLAAMAAALLGAVLVLGGIFFLAPLTAAQVMIVAGLALAGGCIMLVISRLMGGSAAVKQQKASA